MARPSTVSIKLLFLPPYSPGLNPIEQVIATLKHLMRKAAEHSRPLAGAYFFRPSTVGELHAGTSRVMTTVLTLRTQNKSKFEVPACFFLTTMPD